MLKKIIGLAAIAASGLASAQSSVTLFGVLDLSYESVKTNAGRISGIAPSAYRSSRLGFRGVEDLGGGLSAGFWLESAINPSNGIGTSGTSANNQTTTTPSGGLTFNRRSTVSLSGGFGEIRVGRDYTPSYQNYWPYDPFGNNGVGASLTAYSGAFEAATFVRASNSIGYFLPREQLGGFYGQAMYALGNRPSNETFTGTSPAYAVGQSTQNNGRYFGVQVGYAQGPVNTSVGYGRTTNAPGTRTGSVFELASFPYGNFTDLSWGGSYKIGAVKAMAIVSRHTMSDAGALGTNAVEKNWGVGLDWGVGQGNVLASYSRANLSGLMTAEPRASKWAVGYVHNLSKRTALFAFYANVSNANGAALSAASYSSGALGDVAGPANVNGRSTGFEVGLSHAF